MANNAMGQYRYSGKELETSYTNPVISYKPVATNIGSSTDNASFQDILISLPNNEAFKQNQDYHVKITIPRDMNYTMDFDIQLIKGGSNDSVYQFIKNVSLEQGGTATNIYNVSLYEDRNGVIKVMMPLDFDTASTYTNNYIYYSVKNDKYYMGKGSKSYEAWGKVNTVAVAASWLTEKSTLNGVFDFVFRPVESGFTGILLRMVRTAEDYNIQFIETDINGSNFTRYGRKINKDDVVCEIQALKNLVSLLNPYEDKLTRIGVWARPGFLMVINGEEIRVPANGYYELDALTITSLGMAAHKASDKDINGNQYGYEDFYTIDYEYEIPED